MDWNLSSEREAVKLTFALLVYGQLNAVPVFESFQSGTAHRLINGVIPRVSLELRLLGALQSLFTNFQSLGLLVGGTGTAYLSVEGLLIIKIAVNTYCALHICQVLF